MNLEFVNESIADVHNRIAQLDGQRARDLRDLRTEMHQVQANLDEQDREFAVNGVPLAAFGVGLATVGLLLQGIGSALPAWGS
jgi:hypothetical protein